ncbi:MAG: ribose 5-phosphate isomerase B [Hespellia sp.]|nr:ribose 5-phosphate isomerase B [Hespellia sp.]
MKIAIGNDHAAVTMKNEIMKYVEELGHEVINFGTDTSDSCDYPEYGENVGRAVVSGEADFGILICGTGVGISISANKVNGVRAAVCSEPVTARLVRAHNDANIIAFGERIVGIEIAKEIVRVFLTTEFEGGRHQRRVDLMMEIERKNFSL